MLRPTYRRLQILLSRYGWHSLGGRLKGWSEYLSWAAVSQLANAGTNVAVTLLLARSLGARQFGEIAVGMTLLPLILAGLRGFVLEPAVVHGDLSLRSARRTAIDASIAGIVAGTGLVTMVVALGGPSSLAVLLSIGVVATATQEAERWILFGLDLPRRAASLDLDWAAVQGVGLILVGTHSAQAAAATWVAGALVSAVHGWLRVSSACTDLPPSAPQRRWQWGIEHLLAAGTLQFAVLLAPITGGIAVAGGLRGAMSLLGGATVLLGGTQQVVAGRLRLIPNTRALRRWGTGISLALGILVAVASVPLLLITNSLGRHLLGATWPITRIVLPLLIVQKVCAASASAPIFVLRRLEEHTSGVWWRLALTVLTLALVMIGAKLGSASGAAAALAIGSAVSLLIWMRMLWVVTRTHQEFAMAFVKRQSQGPSHTAIQPPLPIPVQPHPGTTFKPPHKTIATSRLMYTSREADSIDRRETTAASGSHATPHAPALNFSFRVAQPETLFVICAKWLIPILLFLVAPLTFHLDLANAFQSLPSFIALAFYVGSGARICWILFAGDRSILDLTFWIFVLTFFGIVALRQLQAQTFPLLHTSAYSSTVILRTQLRIAVGILAYIVGRLISRHHGAAYTLQRWHRLTIRPRRVRILGLLGCVISVLLIAMLGLRPFFTSRDALALSVFGRKGVTGFQVYALKSKGTSGLKQLAFSVPVFVAIVYLIATRGWRRHIPLFCALVILNLIVNNPISNARYWTGMVLAGLLAAAVRLDRKGRSVLFAVVLLIATLYGFTYLNVFRRTGNRAVTLQSPAQIVLATPDYAMFQQEMNATAYVDRHDYTLGRQITAAALVYVPRSFWAGKPGPTGDLVARDSIGRSDGYNVSSSLWTELYIDFGYPELILGFLALGSFYKLLDSLFASGQSRLLSVLIPVLAAYSIIFLRGSLQPVLAQGVPVFLVFLACVAKDTPAQGRMRGSGPAPDATTLEVRIV